jgi:hypothetical protein
MEEDDIVVLLVQGQPGLQVLFYVQNKIKFSPSRSLRSGMKKSLSMNQNPQSIRGIDLQLQCK